VDKPEQWGRIKEIVGAALERVPGERPAFLNEVCGADESIRAEVESLLSAYESGDGLSESAVTQTFSGTAQISKSIGPYRLVQTLGEGGMGQVWLAEQTSPVQRRVALKLVKPGVYDDSVLRRFQSERQSLAIMDHPVIAKVFDAGATPDGHPYFVMEYVPGVAITDYCDQKKLKIRERLELFLRVCEGVQHAHQKAILHRDLKPANILVVEVDGRPVPRIIDFGLAKPVTPYLSGETMNTRLGGLVGTPGYMSPEQTDPGGEGVDTRTDVYSLGVVLYELLTGFLPFDAERLKKLRLEEVLRHLREEDPPRPSTKVSTERDTSNSRAEARGTAPRQLSSELRGDLDWIAMKALEKERNRRYGTPSELAADIGRYLNNEPVAARPASAAYRLRKYVRRHRAGVAVGAGLAILLVTFAVTQAVQLRRITRERDRANRIAAFMTSMFNVSNPSEARGNSVTAREILDKASKEIDPGLAGDPQLQAQMMSVMGSVYESLGLYPQAQTLLSQAMDSERRVLGTEDPDTLRSAAMLAWVLMEEGKYPEAEKLQRETLEIQRHALGPEHPDTMLSMNRLAGDEVSEARYADAEKLYREILEIRRRVSGPEHRETLRVATNLGMCLQEERRYAEAEKILRETLEIDRRILGPDHPDTLHTMRGLASALDDQGRYADSEKIYREVVEMDRRILGPEHPETGRAMHRLALVLEEQGRYNESEKVYRETLDLKRRVLGPEHQDTIGSVLGLALVLAHEGRWGEAEPLFRQSVQRSVKLNQESFVGDAWYDFACGAAVAGHREEAIQYLRKAVEISSPDANEEIDTDDDLKSIRDDPRYQALVREVRAKVGPNPAQ
jgi:eukaryotic-like serine/threonine-protein kinase